MKFIQIICSKGDWDETLDQRNIAYEFGFLEFTRANSKTDTKIKNRNVCCHKYNRHIRRRVITHASLGRPIENYL